MTAFDGILARLREVAPENVRRGAHFEKLVKFYLQNDPLHKNRFDNVWLWREWRQERGASAQDVGIDLVAQERAEEGGGVWAIQAKFYEENTPISRPDIDSFFTASGKNPFTNRMLVSTTENWGKHAEYALRGQQIPCQRIGLEELRRSGANWAAFLDPKQNKSLPKNSPRPHQEEAIAKVLAGLAAADRGKLVMACGTGKTFTSLKIAERSVPHDGHVLFLVPSLSLLSQALREWSLECERPLRNFVVCSDAKVGRDREDIFMHDIALPATTKPAILSHRLGIPFERGTERLNVVFSTYHSLDVIHKAQAKHGAPDFDLVICDEAHRTTGAEKLSDKGEREASYFIAIHNQKTIRAKKRLYMTATPRIYSPETRKKAADADIAVYSMDDEEKYGKELHRLGFADAARAGLLADYKVLVLAVREKDAAALSPAAAMRGAAAELPLGDAAKIIGCWNGLAKRFVNPDNTPLSESERRPMRRAVAFSSRIRDSRQTAATFNDIAEKHGMTAHLSHRLRCEVRHIDGGMNALQRARGVQWLKDAPPADEDGAPQCRILSNAKCLSEGVDVPALDAVIFLSPRKSQIDVVQAVGRAMRRAEGKEYGYVILPLVLPQGVEPEQALSQDPNAYKVVWQVLQALRAHDERFNDVVNKIELNKEKPDVVNVIGVAPPGEEGEGGNVAPLPLPFPEIAAWREAILARVVQKCGDVRYWEDWAKEVAKIAQTSIVRIKALLRDSTDPAPRQKFERFLKRLRRNLNPSVGEDDAIEMLSQHLITRPVFEALFEGYAFAKLNPVSKGMEQMVKTLQKHGLESETRDLQGFYDNVRRRAAGIDNAAGKQRVMAELYEKFFAIAFKKHAEKLGIVYTPVEVVDFILQSADIVLRREFGRGLSDENVHVLDPFTGTGTFLSRLLREECPLIADADLARKYGDGKRSELHANEITLLAYYIAAVNIEETYHHRRSKGGGGGGNYCPFGGIVLADTFQQGEGKGGLYEDEILKENSERGARQEKTKITVIVGNPPYSAGQRSANDNNPNQSYSLLDKRIADTYVAAAKAKNVNSLYDSYIRALRWATDRIGDEGVIAFVTNGSFIDGNAAAGIRKYFLQDFSAVYCLNLRGDAHTSGEERRRERGNVFGGGTRTPIAITILVKNGKQNSKGGVLYYCDIGDYLTTDDKLKKITEYQHCGNIPWQTIAPNAEHDWINQRDPSFYVHMPMGDDNNRRCLANVVESVFTLYSRGVATGRDAWVYGYSKEDMAARMKGMIDFYNQQVDNYANREDKSVGHASFIDYNSRKIKWDRTLEKGVLRRKNEEFSRERIRHGAYRPFNKQWLYYHRRFNNMLYRTPSFFPNPQSENLAIVVSGLGATKGFSALMVDSIPNLHFMDTGQCFPLYRYDVGKSSDGLITERGGRHDNIPDATLRLFREQYGDEGIGKADIFYYVYGVLHSPEYKERYAGDLKKMLPRIPRVADKAAFWQYSAAGRKLGDLHVNYESAPEYPLREIRGSEGGLLEEERDYAVTKMRFGKGADGKADKSVIRYNETLRLEGVPAEAYAYRVNGKSALEWLMERYAKTVDAKSGIANNPNVWSDDARHIVSLLKRVTHVSMESVHIIASLPPLGL